MLFKLILALEALTILVLTQNSVFINYPSFDYVKSIVQNSREYLNDVVLNHQLPPIFIVGEVFRIEGYAKEEKITEYKKKNNVFTSSPYQKYPVTVFFMNKRTREKQFYFTQKIAYGQANFSIQCYLQTPGKYYIGIFVGVTGVYYPKIYEIKKMSQPPGELRNLNLVPQNLTLSIQNNDCLIRWKPKTPLTKIVFKQTGKQKDFIVSNDNGKLLVPYVLFKEFQQGKIQICIMHADSQDLSAYKRSSSFSTPLFKTINATQHHFSQVMETMIEIQGELPSKAKVNQSLEIKGKWKQYVSSKAYILEPGNYIRITRLKMDFWRKQFVLKVLVKKEGVYIVQINHKFGYAVVNSPIYVGESFPIIPDFQDISPEIINISKINKNFPKKLHDQRLYILKKINQKRYEFGVAAVKLDQELNQLAQKHSDEMAKYRYAAHKNRKNQSSSQRAKNMGITTEVKENIASCYSVDYCQNGLNRSPAHLTTTVKAKWARVGVGIAKDINDVYYITQQFSTIAPEEKDLSEEEIVSIEDQIVHELSVNGKFPVEENKQLSKQIVRYHNLYGFSWTLALIGQISARFGVRNSRRMYLSLSHTGNFVQFLKSRGYFYNTGYTKVGLSVKIAKDKIQLIGVLY